MHSKGKSKSKAGAGDNEDEGIELSSEDSSDGETALQIVRSRAPQEVRRGPKSDTLNHWHEPNKTLSGGKLRWEFRCRHCKMYVLSFLLMYISQ